MKLCTRTQLPVVHRPRCYLLPYRQENDTSSKGRHGFIIFTVKEMVLIGYILLYSVIIETLIGQSNYIFWRTHFSGCGQFLLVWADKNFRLNWTPGLKFQVDRFFRDSPGKGVCCLSTRTTKTLE